MALPIDRRPCDNVVVGEQELGIVDSFCHLGDTICPGGGCELATITRTRNAWERFQEILPFLKSKSLSLGTRGKVYSTELGCSMLESAG